MMTNTMTDERALELVRWLTNGSDATPPPQDVTLQQAYNHIASRLSALQAQQPGAQAVAQLRGVDEYGPMLDWFTHWAKFAAGTKLYTQPPSTPEPSELRKVAKRNLRSMIERGSDDKALMLKCLEELS